MLPSLTQCLQTFPISCLHICGYYHAARLSYFPALLLLSWPGPPLPYPTSSLDYPSSRLTHVRSRHLQEASCTPSQRALSVMQSSLLCRALIRLPSNIQ